MTDRESRLTTRGGTFGDGLTNHHDDAPDTHLFIVHRLLYNQAISSQPVVHAITASLLLHVSASLRRISARTTIHSQQATLARISERKVLH
jgi:hypothetical protein